MRLRAIMIAALVWTGSACTSAAPLDVPDGAAAAVAAEPWVIDPERIYHDVARLSAPEMDGRLPGTAGGELAADYVEGVFAELGLVPGGTHGYRQFFPVTLSGGPAGTANIIAVTAGTSPELRAEAIVVGAHLDAVAPGYPGADDNASGVAVMLELARAVVKTDLRPARAIVFAAFQGEETGHSGSNTYCQEPRRPLDRTVAMLSVDMVGLGDGTGLQLHPGNLSPPVGWVVAAFQDAAAADGLAGTVAQGFAMDNSDHACFARAGVPAMLVNTPGAHLGYHTLDDRAERLDREGMALAARLLWAGLRALAP